MPPMRGILDSLYTVMRQLAIKGLSKLLLSGKIISAHVLPQLILMNVDFPGELDECRVFGFQHELYRV